MSRKKCLLENQELINTALKLQGELSKDFSESLLEECDKCSAEFDAQTAKRIHLHLIVAYTELTALKNILREKN